MPERRPEISKASATRSPRSRSASPRICSGTSARRPRDSSSSRTGRWIPGLGVRYIVGVDGISIFMVARDRAVVPARVARVGEVHPARVKAYIAWFLLLEGAIMGVFLALDLILFFVFLELMLVPMYFLIQGWGSERREYAAIEVLPVHDVRVGIPPRVDCSRSRSSTRPTPGRSRSTSRCWRRGTGCPAPPRSCSSSASWSRSRSRRRCSRSIRGCPLVHTEAPTAGSVVLAGVILKMGAYGLLRFSFELFPQAVGRPRADPARARGDRHHLRRHRRGDANRLETRHRVLVGRAHGFRGARASSRSRSSASTVPSSRC